jgi:hypothetical protein
MGNKLIVTVTNKLNPLICCIAKDFVSFRFPTAQYTPHSLKVIIILQNWCVHTYIHTYIHTLHTRTRAVRLLNATLFYVSKMKDDTNTASLNV